MTLHSGKSTPSKVQILITTAQDVLGLSNAQIADSTGYATNVVSMIRSGQMRLPPQKVPAMAKCLHLDAGELMHAVLLETDPALLEALEHAFDKSLQPELKKSTKKLRPIPVANPASKKTRRKR